MVVGMAAEKRPTEKGRRNRAFTTEEKESRRLTLRSTTFSNLFQQLKEYVNNLSKSEKDIQKKWSELAEWETKVRKDQMAVNTLQEDMHAEKIRIQKKRKVIDKSKLEAVNMKKQAEKKATIRREDLINNVANSVLLFLKLCNLMYC